jgi:hypothetical protein
MRSLSTRAAGLLILIGGLWGGLAPFIGPYFHFVLGPDKAWTWTSGRLWLNVIPGIVAVIAGLMLLGSGPGAGGRLGALLAIAAGAWFAIGPDVSQWWHAGGAQGVAHGAKTTRIFEMLAFHTLLGVAIATLGGYALPGLPRRRAVTAADEMGAAEATRTGRRPAEPVTAESARTERTAEPVGAEPTRTERIAEPDEAEPTRTDRTAEPVGAGPARTERRTVEPSGAPTDRTTA